jgi:competence protein ComEC
VTARVPIVALFIVAVASAALGLAAPLPASGLALPVGVAAGVVAVLAFAASRVRADVLRGAVVVVAVGVLAATAAVVERARFAARVAALPGSDRLVIVDADVVDAVDADEGRKLRVLVRALGPDLLDGAHDASDAAGARRSGGKTTLDADGPGFVVDVALLAPVDVQPGDRVRLRGRLRPPAPALSPGTFDAEAAALVEGVHGRLAVVDVHDVAVLGHRPPAWSVRARVALSQRLQEQLPPRLAGLLLALLIGDTSLFEEEQSQAYRHVGAGHLLAVSGLQVTLLAGVLVRLVTTLFLLTGPGRRGRGAGIAAALALLGVWGFVALCGAPPSAVRAAIMASAVVGAGALGRRALLEDALAAAGLVTVVAAPSAVLDAGFLLSYAAVLGLVATSAKTAPIGDDDGGTVLGTLRDTAITSVVAGLVTLPLSAWLFAQLAPAGLVANIVLVPVASLLQLPALLGGALGAAFDLDALSFLGGQAALLLEALVFGLADLLPGVRTIDAPPAWLAGVLTTSAALAAALLLARRRLAAVVVVVVAAGGVGIAGARLPAGLRVTFLPVGQGDAAVVELPDGTVFVVDGGGRVPLEPGLDAAGRAEVLAEPGRRVVVPYLLRRGIERVDVLVLSHAHPDHAGGLHAVVDALPVDALWWAGDPGAVGPLVRPLVTRVGTERVTSTPGLLGRHTFGDVVVDVLAPAPEEGGATYPELHANDNSLVLRFCLGQTCVLLPGDLERFGEELLLASARDRVVADVVKAPHHGSATSSTPAFVAATGATDVVFCTGRDNHFGFPAPDIVKRWATAGAQVWDTARHGEVTFVLDGTRVFVRPFRDDAR